MTDLTNKQKAFVEAYLRTWNATQAAREAGYAHPGQRGCEALKNVTIRGIVKQRLSDMAMDADEVLARLADQARFDPGPYIILEEGKDPFIDLSKLRDDGLTRLIKAITPTIHGTQVKLYDAQVALNLLARHHGLLIDKTALTDPSGKEPYDPTSSLKSDLLSALRGLASTSPPGTVDREPDE